jgi:hypothetical protein
MSYSTTFELSFNDEVTGIRFEEIYQNIYVFGNVLLILNLNTGSFVKQIEPENNLMNLIDVLFTDNLIILLNPSVVKILDLATFNFKNSWIP